MTQRLRAESGGIGRTVAVIAAIVGAVLLIAVGVALAWYNGVLGASNASAVPVTVVIPAGSSSASIAQQLQTQGVIASALRFRLRARDQGAVSELKAGKYELSTGMPDDVVIQALVAGPKAEYTDVTIPEGWTIPQIATRLEKETGIPAKEFERLAKTGASTFSAKHPYLADAYGGSLEGFLFPKTYRIKKGANAETVIGMMLDQFDKEIGAVDVTSARKQGLSLNEVVTIASIIEREAGTEKDRPLVSSVIHNRLAQNMRLQMCSTVVYVLGRRELRLTVAETFTKSPYNTYRHSGLPPGPISNPGLASLKAAVAPADTQYLYYVLTGKDGSHTFTRTLAEFEAAKKKSKQVFGQ